MMQNDAPKPPVTAESYMRFALIVIATVFGGITLVVHDPGPDTRRR